MNRRILQADRSAVAETVDTSTERRDMALLPLLAVVVDAFDAEAPLLLTLMLSIDDVFAAASATELFLFSAAVRSRRFCSVIVDGECDGSSAVDETMDRASSVQGS